MYRNAIRSLSTAAQSPSSLGARTAVARSFATSDKASTSPSDKDEAHPEQVTEQKAQEAAAKQQHTKTQAQLDEELRQKMMSIAGDGGEAGVELEDGQPVAMKRSVKNNMFRYI